MKVDNKLNHQVLTLNRDYLEAEINARYSDDKKEQNRLYKLLENTDEGTLKLHLWRIDDDFMDRISELGENICRIIWKVGEKMKDILEVLKIMHSILDRLTLAVGKEHERIKDIEYRISVLELEKKSKQLLMLPTGNEFKGNNKGDKNGNMTID